MTKKKQEKKPVKLYLKRGDEVQVISGKEKGGTGKIIKVDSEKMRLYVEGLNMQTKHVKPNQENPDGGIVKQEGPIHYSNVLLYNKSSEKGERIRIQVTEDGSKTRIFAKSGTPVD